MSKAGLGEPSPRGWKLRMTDLHKDCTDSLPVEQAGRIREAARLLGGGVSLPVGCPPVSISSDVLETMLAAGAFESAVLYLMGGQSAFMLSRSGNGSCLASVVRADGAEEITAEGATPALALLAAHVLALSEESGLGHLPAEPEWPKPGLRLN